MLQYSRYLTLFPGFPLIPGEPINPRGPFMRKEESRQMEKCVKKQARGQKVMNSVTKKDDMMEASSEVKIMSGLTGGPLSPLSPLSPEGP